MSNAVSGRERLCLRSVIRTCCALVLSIAAMGAIAAEGVGVVTLLEGPAAVVRGTVRYALAEGVRFRPGDVLEIGEKSLAEIEFPNGTALALGPGTSVLAIEAGRGRAAAGDYYVVRGVLKLSRVKQDATFRFVTPLFALQPVEGSVVFVPGAAAASVFVETGEARVTEPPAKGAAPAPVQLKSGQFYTRKADQKASIAPRPSSEFVAALPRFFLDPLPSRMARYKDQEVQPKRVEEVSYADVQQWLQAPPDIRRPLMQRFRPRLADPAFRAGLVANLKLHPEWDPILFPEKYERKEPGTGGPAKAAPGGMR